MREIKFRAWDVEKKELINPEDVELSWLPDGSLLVNGSDRVAWSEYDDSKISYLNQFELMQFTGLRDKNGKEIYEGDVIKHTMGDMYEVIYGDKQLIPAFCLKNKTINVMIGPGVLEVIGNIYENPELLVNK